jgi:hypothetical protein
MKNISIILFLALAFWSCKNDASEESQSELPSSTDTVERLDTIFSSENIAFLNQLDFSKYARSESSAIDWNRFRMVTSTHEESPMVTPFTPDRLFYQHYGKLLKYSPDSSMFIDIDSYNIELQKNKKGDLVPIENGPDTEVNLVDVEKKQKTRLIFLGPGNGVEEAGWIDNQTAILIGYRETDTTKTKNAVIWRYHVPTKTFHVYETANPNVAALLINWRKERLRQFRQSADVISSLIM